MATGQITGTRRATEKLDPEVLAQLPQDFREAIDFHGHLCPGLTIGYRAARIAMERLGVERGTDEELLGIMETDSCGVDAFQYLTGCTLGKGNLVYKDYGKQAFTVARRSDGRGVRVVMLPNAFAADPEHSHLKDLVMSGKATPEERARFGRCHIDKALDLLGRSAESFAKVQEVTLDLPSKAQLFDSVTCSFCGESVMEPRSRVRNGQPCCIPCATRYGRGWEINE